MIKSKEKKKKRKLVLLSFWFILLFNFHWSGKCPPSGMLRVWGHTSLKKSPGNFRYFTLSFRNFKTKQRFSPPWNPTELCYTPSWKFQNQKLTPVEVPHDFSSITPGNCTSFLIKPWNPHMLFPQLEFPCP